MIICKYLSVIGILVNTASLMIFRNTISYEKKEFYQREINKINVKICVMVEYA